MFGSAEIAHWAQHTSEDGETTAASCTVKQISASLKDQLLPHNKSKSTASKKDSLNQSYISQLAFSSLILHPSVFLAVKRARIISLHFSPILVPAEALLSPRPAGCHAQCPSPSPHQKHRVGASSSEPPASTATPCAHRAQPLVHISLGKRETRRKVLNLRARQTWALEPVSRLQAEADRCLCSFAENVTHPCYSHQLLPIFQTEGSLCAINFSFLNTSIIC